MLKYQNIGIAIFFFLVGLALGGAALVFLAASARIYTGATWAIDVCSTSELFALTPNT